MARVKPRRRTQAERSAEMRQRLLDAAIDCLVEYGYAATTSARGASERTWAQAAGSLSGPLHSSK